MSDRPSTLARRASGILLHPTSLGGGHGIGDLGQTAYEFVDFLASSGQSLWQVLPLGPPGFGNSPYQCLSSAAGNPLLVSLDRLARDGWLDAGDLAPASDFPRDRVDFSKVIPFKEGLLRKASQRFFEHASPEALRSLQQFVLAKPWLHSFSRFTALKEANQGRAWTEWAHQATPDPGAVKACSFAQFQFFNQWNALKRYAAGKGVQCIGDLPIFPAHDSADVWARPEIFDLDRDGRPRVVAGVPPDYFSATGQRWGNPLYRWDELAKDGFQWWIERVRAVMELVDVVRLDHFRGFERYYEVPADSPTAEHGRWVEGPGGRLFEALQNSLGTVPIIAEDLGLITPEVDRLREQFHFPGIRVLQFAFASLSSEDRFKPYNHERGCVVYTGTHDNDTVAGWFHAKGSGNSTRGSEEAERERRLALRYLGSDGREIHWDFIRAALGSVANTAIIPLQDVLGLGSEARMNLPSDTGDNWSWRFRSSSLLPELSDRLRCLTETYGRCATAAEPDP